MSNKYRLITVIKNIDGVEINRHYAESDLLTSIKWYLEATFLMYGNCYASDVKEKCLDIEKMTGYILYKDGVSIVFDVEYNSNVERLKDIDNANPTEALEDLKELHKLAYDIDVWKIEDIVQSSHIKQALLKAQEQEKVLNIIKEKNVDIWLLKSCLTVEQYNFGITKIDSCDVFNLTQEEFDTLKKWSR